MLNKPASMPKTRSDRDHTCATNVYEKEKKKKLGAYAIKRVAAGAHLPTPWLFEPAKRTDDKAD